MEEKEQIDYDYLSKILIIGDSAVGKSCMLLRFVEDKFNVHHVMTIGIDFMSKTLDVKDKKIRL